nr:putative ribonuclease H-like domain-containing protein [Tanacetum cinerariifolium]
PTAGQNSSNRTNPFSAVGPSNTTASPTYGKSSFKDASQLPENPDMLEIEDITYSDHENVGAEVDFNNLETSITVSPIPTTITHKDHPASQIIGDLSSTTQTRSMTRVIKDHGGLLQIFNDDFHTCMFACFLSQKEPKRAIGTKWVYRNKKDERGIVVRNESRLVAQGHTQEERIDYEEVFAPVARIEAIRLFLAYASFMGFMVYQMDVNQKKDGIFISQDKYVAKNLKKFRLTKGKSASTPIDTKKPLLKDPDVKRIFRYLKGKPHLGLWYPKNSPFDLVAYSDSDYAGVRLDKKSTTRGYQFLGCRLISWQYKKQTVAATSSIESNDVTRLQALVDKKKVMITEATIRDTLRLDDAEGVNCLPNEEIFAKLARMGYEKPSTKLTFYKAFFSSQWKFLIHTILQSMSAKCTSWNEFSSAMASAVICLSTGDLLTHTTKYISPALTQKVFANMRRVGKGCSGVETPLFEGMLVAREPEEQGNAEEQVQGNVNDAAQGADIAVLGDDLKIRVKKLKSANKVKTLKLKRLKKVETSQRFESSDDVDMEDASNQGRMIADLDRDEVVTAASESITAASTAISAVEPQVPVAAIKIAAPVRVAAASTRKRKGVVIKDPEEEPTSKTHAETKSKDKGKGIMVEEPKPIKKKQQVKMDKEYARKLHEELNKDIDWDVAIDHVKQKAKEDSYVQSFGVDAAMELEEKHQVFNAAGEELSAAKHKLMLLDTAAKRRLLLLSQDQTVNEKCYC